MLARLVLLVLAILALPVSAADIAGHWTYRIGDVPIFGFDIVRTPRDLTGVWRLPEHWDSDFDSFYDIAGPVTDRRAGAATEHDGRLELTFDDPAPNSFPDTMTFRLIDADHAAMSWTHWPGSFPLTRDAAAAPLGPWDPQKTYARVLDRPTNAEMTAIFTADQAARQAPMIDWHVVARRTRHA